MVVVPDALLLAAQEQVAAAWVQAGAAIGQALLSVATIIVAFRIAATDRRHEAKLRNTDAEAETAREKVTNIRRARTAGLGILPPLLDIFSELSWAAGQLKDGKPPHEIGNYGPNPAENLHLWNMPALTAELKSLQPTLSELDSAAAPVQTAYFSLFHLQDEFDGFRRSMRGDDRPEHQWQFSDHELKRIPPLLAETVERTDAAIKAISNLFRGMANER